MNLRATNKSILDQLPHKSKGTKLPILHEDREWVASGVVCAANAFTPPKRLNLAVMCLSSLRYGSRTRRNAACHTDANPVTDPCCILGLKCEGIVEISRFGCGSVGGERGNSARGWVFLLCLFMRVSNDNCWDRFYDMLSLYVEVIHDWCVGVGLKFCALSDC